MARPTDRPARPSARRRVRAPEAGSNGRNGAGAEPTATEPATAPAPGGPAAAPSASPDPESVEANPLRRAVAEAARLLEADGAIAYLIDDADGRLRFAFDAGITEEPGREWVREIALEIGVGMYGRAVETRQVGVTGNYPRDASFHHAGETDRLVSDLNIRSLVVAPLLAAGQVLGALGTFTSRPDDYGPQQVALVRALADHAAQALANARLIDELDRSRAELAERALAERTLREIAIRLTEPTDPADIIQRTVDEAARLLRATGSRIDLVDLDANQLRWAYQSGGTRPTRTEWPDDPDDSIEVGVSGRAVMERRVVWTGDYLADDRFVHGTGPDAYIRSVGIRSVMAAPLSADSEPFGSLTVYTTEPDVWDEDDASRLEALASQAATAMSTARRIEQLARSREDLARRVETEQALRRIGSRLPTIHDPGDLLQLVVEEAGRLVRADGAVLDLLDPDRNALRWSYDNGIRGLFTPNEVEDLWIAVGEGATGIAVAEDRVVMAVDHPEAQFPPSAANDRFFGVTGFRSMIISPITGDGGPLGALEVYSTRDNAFDAADAALIRALADQAAIAIQNARLIEALAGSRSELAHRADVERALREIAARVTALHDTDEVLAIVARESARLLDADGTMISLPDEDRDVIVSAAGEDLTQARAGFIDQVKTEPDGGLSGMAYETASTLISEDYLNDDRFEHTESRDTFIAEAGIRSVMASPLIGEAGRPIGAITLFSTRTSVFAPDDVVVIEAFAHQAAIAIGNARRLEQLAASRAELALRADRERTLREITATLASLRDPDELLQRAVVEADRLLASDGARIDLYDPERHTLRWAFRTGAAMAKAPAWAIREGLAVGEGVGGRAFERQAPQRTDDYLADETVARAKNPDSFVRRARIKSVLSVPLVADGEAFGVLTAVSRRRAAYDDDAEAILMALAAQAAIAIRNARLFDEIDRSRAALSRRADQERALREIAARITALRDADEVLERVVQASCRLLDADGAHLTRMIDDGTSLQPVVVAGGMDARTAAWLKALRFPIGGGVNGNAALSGAPYWTEDYLADERIPQEPSDKSTARRLGLRGMAAVPLRAPGGGTIGTLAVSYRRPHAFADEELAVLQGLGDQAAIALANTDLYRRLEESERSYRHLVENSPDIIWSMDADANFTFLSDTCERLTGWRPDELLGRHFGAIVHDSSSDVAELDWTSTMDRPSSEIRGRVNLLGRDGRPIPAEFIAITRLGPGGEFLGANGSVRDMTETDRLERELRQSEARYRNLSQSSPDLVFATDAEGRYTFLSDRAVELFGAAAPSMVGRTFVEFVAPDWLEAARESYRAVIAEPGRVHRTLLGFLDESGGEIPLEILVVGSVEDGVLTSIHGVARDIRERERLERELRNSEARYRFLLENSPDVVFSTDQAGEFTFISDGVSGLTGFQPSQVVGQHFRDLIHPDSIGTTAARWREVTANPDLVLEAIIDLRTAAGGSVPVEIKATGMTDGDGRFAGLHGSARDISERVRLESDLRRGAAELAASEERAHLARELHDSVTQALFSMTLVSRSVELLMDRDQDAAKTQLNALRELQREALAEMRALIFELRPGNLEESGLIAALRTHTAALQGRLGLPIRVDSRLGDRLPIEVENVLYRIAQEALHNVVKHAAAREVRIRVERTGAHGRDVAMTISDDGRGFDPGSVPDGHLGLAGMRARAERIGATFSADSAPGEGTTIVVTVPDVARGEPLPASAGPRRSSAE